MIDIANKYETELKKLYMNTWYDEKYKFYHANVYCGQLKIEETNWNNHEFVSIDKNNNIIGYIAYSIDRVNERVYGLKIINFTENKIVFGKDLKTVLCNIFEKFKFRKLSFIVIVGNPIEKSYDKLISKYGGRIVGTYKKNTKLIDNELYDQKMYEIFKEDYFNSKKEINKKGE